MPSDKDFKRLVRARMRKTGEAYTSARARLLQKRSAPSQALPVKADFAAQAGMADAALEVKTGHPWRHWVKILDRAGAAEWPHARIARYVREEHGLPSWWCQAVTVGYERIKGLREVGQRRDGTFEASKSRTFAVPLARLYRAWSDSRLRKQWLPGVTLTVRTTVPRKSMRITWTDGTPVDVWFVRKTAAKSQVAVQHRKLPDKRRAAETKGHWEERLRALGEVLAAMER